MRSKSLKRDQLSSIAGAAAAAAVGLYAVYIHDAIAPQHYTTDSDANNYIHESLTLAYITRFESN